MRLAELLSAGEALYEALGREGYLTGAGLKSPPEFQQIYDRFPQLASDEALEAARDSGSLELHEWALDVRIGRLVAPLDERQITWEQDAVLRVGEREVPYLRAPIEMANNPERKFRIALDEARGKAAAAGLNAIRRDHFAIERDELAGAGFGDYVTARGTLSGIDLESLGGECERFLEATADMYRDSLARLVKRRLGVGLGDLARSDAAWAFRADGFDSAFPPNQLLNTATRQAREMGLDVAQGGRIHFDTDERAGKQPRAFCSPVRVPGEVYLVLRPRGGHTDYRTFWHELGHALHFASMDPDLPFAARWLGDNSVTEGFAMLWDHLPLESLWLKRYTDLTDSDLQDLLFELHVAELFMIRRYTAKLGYELRLHRGDLSTMDTEYVERLSAATGFRYLPDDYLIDVDPGFYSARYLRAWQFQAGLAAHLVERFDVDWYRNPRAGLFVQHLMSGGQSRPADQLARESIGAQLSFAPVARRFETALS